MKIGVSKCLFGYECRYDGKSKPNQEIMDLLKNHEIVLICPEELGGLSTPRPSSERQNNKWINTKGENVTNYYLKGAKEAYKLIEDCDFVISKAKSPACGKNRIYDGTFTKTLTNGNGSFVEECLKNNKRIYNENEIEDIKGLIKEKLD